MAGTIIAKGRDLAESLGAYIGKKNSFPSFPVSQFPSCPAPPSDSDMTNAHYFIYDMLTGSTDERSFTDVGTDTPQTPMRIGVTHTDRIRSTIRVQGWASTTRPAVEVIQATPS